MSLLVRGFVALGLLAVPITPATATTVISADDAVELARGHTTLVELVSVRVGPFGVLDTTHRTGPGYPVDDDRWVWAVAFHGVEEACGGPWPGECRWMDLTATVFLDRATGAFLGMQTRGTTVDVPGRPRAGPLNPHRLHPG